MFAKDIGSFSIAYNIVFEFELKNNWVYEHKYAVGINYEVVNKFKVGIESKGSYSKNKYSLGHTIAVVTRQCWFSFGPQWGLNDSTNFLDTRFLIGIPF